MRTLFPLLLALLVLAGCSGPQAGVATEKSPQGRDYIRLFVPGAHEVAIRIAWPTDWAYQDHANQAVPYLARDLILSGGAEGYKPGLVVERFADMKAEGRLAVSPDFVIGSLTVPKEHLSEAVEIAHAHLSAPSLDDGWLDRIKQGLAVNIAEASAQPANMGFSALRWAIFGDVPLRQALSLDPASQITAARRDDLVHWHKAVLLSDTAKIVIAGDLDAQQAGETVDSLMAGLPRSSGQSPPKKPAARFEPRRILLHVPSAKTSTLTLLAPLPPAREGSTIEDMVLATALGGSDQSVLFDAVRTQLRAAYGFGAGLDSYTQDYRFLIFSGEIETAKLSAAETAVHQAYAAFRSQGLQKDITALKADHVSMAQELLKNPSALSDVTLSALLEGQPVDLGLTYSAVLDKVTAATVDQRLKTVFPKPADFIVLAVSPDPEALPDACVIERIEDARGCH